MGESVVDLSLSALQVILQPVNFLWFLGSLALGVLFGTLPGLSVFTAVIIVLPLTYALPPEVGLMMITAVYVTGVYGGSATAILLNIPGAPENACAALDGYPLNKKGLASKALGVAVLSSALGGLFGTVVLITMAPMMVNWALTFGAREYLAVVLLGCVVSANLHRTNLWKGYISLCLGLLLAAVGLPLIGGTEGQARFTFGFAPLLSGISLTAFAVGSLALTEVLARLTRVVPFEDIKQNVLALPNRKELRALVPVWLRHGVLGTVVGIVPGTGATVASFFSYMMEERYSKKGRQFGTGMIEGVAAPETANNAAAMATLIPLIALGIPGGAVAAIMYVAMQIHGIIPGPLVLIQTPVLVYVIYITALLANAMVLVIGRTEVRHLVHLLKIPDHIMLPTISLLAILGVYNISKDIFSIYVMVAAGFLGLLLRRFDFSVVAVILGLILGPLAEENFVRSQLLYDSAWFLFESPVSGTIMVIAAGLILLNFRGRTRKR